MKRIRFKTQAEDYRPVSWPIKYPYWCSGEGDDYVILITFADSEDYVYSNWPEAYGLVIEERKSITFTDRFPRPNWYEGE
jgi:hypothetical protein